MTGVTRGDVSEGGEEGKYEGEKRGEERRRRGRRRRRRKICCGRVGGTTSRAIRGRGRPKKQKGWNLKAMPHRNEYMILISKAIIAILEVTFHIGYTLTI